MLSRDNTAARTTQARDKWANQHTGTCGVINIINAYGVSIGFAIPLEHIYTHMLWYTTRIYTYMQMYACSDLHVSLL